MKLVFAYMEPETNRSEVEFYHKGKHYFGEAKVHPQEKLPIGRFYGLDIAEKRARIEYLKDRKNINRIKAQAIDSLLNDFYHSNTDAPADLADAIKKINDHKRYYEKERLDCKKEIINLKNAIHEAIALRTKLLSKN